MDIRELYEKFIECEQLISTDTRMIEKGSLFFSWKGEVNDGNAFAREALDKGARYVVIDNPDFFINEQTIVVENSIRTLQELAIYHRKHFDIPIIAIGGSNGKTTTKELIADVLGTQKNVIASLGSHNNHVGVPKTLLRINRTTDVAVIEMGANHLGEIKQLCEIAHPTIGLITNIGRDHIGLFGGPGAVIEANLELYNYLKAKQGHVFVNIQNKDLVHYAKGIDNTTLYGQGIPGEQGIRSLHTVPTISFEWKNYTVNTLLTGEYNMENIAAAIAVGKFFNITDDHIISSLQKFKPQSNRSEMYTSIKGNLIIKDFYNANRTSMEHALENLATMKEHDPKKNSVAILGDMFELGDFSSEDHRAVVDTILEKGIETVILIGKEFRQVASEPQFLYFNTTDEAISGLSNYNFSNSIILLKASNGMNFQKLFDSIEW